MTVVRLQGFHFIRRVQSAEIVVGGFSWVCGWFPLFIGGIVRNHESFVRILGEVGEEH